MPLLAAAPNTVVQTKDVKIDEYFGNASCNPLPGAISFAHVKAGGGWAEEWQAPAFDEYTLVLKGSVTIEYAHGPPVKVSAGQAVFMAKGERVRWVFTEPADYVPICLPAFSPANCFREEPGTAPAPHDAHSDIYHLVQKCVATVPTPGWRAAVELRGAPCAIPVTGRCGRLARRAARRTIRQRTRRTASRTRRPTRRS